MKKSLTEKHFGFTLIEQMIVVAIIGIMATIMPGVYMQAKKLSNDHLLFTKATSALVTQSEIVKSMPFNELKNGTNPDSQVKDILSSVTKGRCEVAVTSPQGNSEVLNINVIVSWQNSWKTEKMIHTVLMRSKP
jgi:prepilin-type N-terminal cleavage/methylation domain-containing protein